MSVQTSEVDYRKMPCLAAYINRIGAEQKNFRRFMVVEHKANGYYSEIALIKIDAEGNVACSDKRFEPTETEAKAIASEWTGFALVMPKCALATKEGVKDLYKKEYAGNNKNSTLYVFHSREVKEREGNVIMVQQRVDLGPGNKYFVNWTFWSDGKWRRMEPDGMLPLWKPPLTADELKVENRGNRRIMVHEGGKTAKFLTEKIKDPEWLAAHPWADTLKEYEHWGMIGGALVPHRTDYTELVREKPVEVMYVCDNDPPGKRALQRVSECYQRSMLGVIWDTRFKAGWDLADDMPSMFYRDGKYKGPPFDEFVTFATYATKLVPAPDGKGRPKAVLSEAFAEEWWHCVQPEVFVHNRWPSMVLNINEFNNHTSPFSHVDDTARLVKKEKATKSAVLAYRPGKPPGLYADPEGSYINTHIPTRVGRKAGDVQPFLDFMAHLIPFEEDRAEMYRWLVTLIARPETKMLYGVLLISEAQGIGKGTLGERVLAPLVGASNVSYPSEGEIVDSNYNYWAAHKRLAVVHEIYAGHSSKAYNKLKSIITDQKITVQKKYQANYEVENWVHVLACSNSLRALQLSSDDRRWFVPRLTEDKRDNTYWHKLNLWLVSGGLEIVHEWCYKQIEDGSIGPVLKGETAPWSGMKKEIVEESYSPGMQMVASMLDQLKLRLDSDEDFRNKLAGVGFLRDGALLTTDRCLQEYIKQKMYEGRQADRIEKPATLRKLAASRGWFINPERIQHLRWGSDQYKARIISLRKDEAIIDPLALAKAGHKLIDLAEVTTV